MKKSFKKTLFLLLMVLAMSQSAFGLFINGIPVTPGAWKKVRRDFQSVGRSFGGGQGDFFQRTNADDISRVLESFKYLKLKNKTEVNVSQDAIRFTRLFEKPKKKVFPFPIELKFYSAKDLSPEVSQTSASGQKQGKSKKKPETLSATAKKLADANSFSVPKERAIWINTDFSANNFTIPFNKLFVRGICYLGGQENATVIANVEVYFEKYIKGDHWTSNAYQTEYITDWGKNKLSETDKKRLQNYQAADIKF